MKILKGFCLLFSYLSFFFLCIVLFSCRTFFVSVCFFLSRTFFPVCRRTFSSGCRTFSLSAVPFIIFSLSYFSPLSRTDFFSLSSLFDRSRIFPSPSYFSPLCRIFIFLHFSFAHDAGTLPDRQAMFPSLASPKKFSIIVCLFFAISMFLEVFKTYTQVE